jgi:hypothetical protein
MIGAIIDKVVEYALKQLNKYEQEQSNRDKRMSEQSIEQLIQVKGLNAPRLTPSDIDAKIKGMGFHIFEGTQTTICILELENGFTVTGESACASPENFDAEIGQKIARENAREKIWQLEGYLLKERLYQESKPRMATTHQQRFSIERDELQVKFNALEDFLNKPQPSFIANAEWYRLKQQYSAMNEYLNILDARIAHF